MSDIKQYVMQCIKEDPEKVKQILKDNGIMLERLISVGGDPNDYSAFRKNMLHHSQTASSLMERELAKAFYEASKMDNTNNEQLKSLNEDFKSIYSQYSSVVDSKGE